MICNKYLFTVPLTMTAISIRKATKRALCNEPQIDRHFGDSLPRSFIRIPLLRAKDGAFEDGGGMVLF